MDNNFNNENEKNLYSGFESPSADNPLNLEFDEPYVQSTISSTAADNLATVKPKKSRKWLVPTLAGLGVAVVAGVCSVLFIPQVNNFFKLNTQNPTSYYQDVEKDNIKETVEEKGEDIKTMTSALSQMTSDIVASTDVTNLTINSTENIAGFSEIKLEINDSIKDYIKSYIAKDGGASSTFATELINSFNSVSIDGVTMINDKQQIAMNLNFTLNENNIISANVIVDYKDYVIYMAIPEITDTVFSFKIPERAISELKDDLKEDMAELEAVYGKLDEAAKYLDDNNEELLEFIEKYSIIVVEGLEDADLSKNVEVDVNDVVVEYTEILVKVDEKMASNIAKNVIEELKDDEFAMDFVAIFDVTEEKYDAAMADLLAELEATDTDDEGSDETIDFYTYVNNKGEIVGRGFGAEGDLISYVTYEKDDEFQFQFSLEGKNENNPVSIIVRGKCNGEDSKSGNIVVELENKNYDFDIECEYKDAELVNEDLGFYSGTFTFSTTFPELEPFAIVFDLDATDKSQTVSMGLLHNNEETVTLELSTGFEDYKEIKIPDNTFEIKETVDPQSLLPELKKLNLVNVKTNLKKALNSETLNSAIDSLFTEYGLDVADGDMTDAEVEQLLKTISSSSTSREEIVYDDDYSYDYEDEFEDDDRTGDDGDPSKFMDYYENGLQ